MKAPDYVTWKASAAAALEREHNSSEADQIIA
jgi:hypothetical protein